MSGTLYIVATPIGNLGDITVRALAILKEADLVLCEDTRVTRKLLSHFEIDTPTGSYHQHATTNKKQKIAELLKEGNNIALVTDAGTPGISDPGNELIADLRLQIADLVIIPVPGASAVTAALSISGFPTNKFIFLGFPPHKNKRRKFFEEVRDAKYTVAFYESAHRIKKCVNELKDILGPMRQICICRELTKKFESIYRGSVEETANMKISEKGEFVVIVKSL